MKLKRYLVRDMAEAMEVIAKDLGPEAVILSSRRVRRGGWRSIFRPPLIEVTAALDEPGDASRPELQVEKENRLVREVAEMKALLQRLASDYYARGEPEELWEWRRLLTELEVSGEIIDYLLQGMEKGCLGQGDKPLAEIICSRMADMFVVPSSELASPVLMFVGPTGVGKTTTIAKLAAQFALVHKKSVSLVTVDTYRIGAVQQLKIYAEILGVPLEVVMTPGELKEVVNRSVARRDYVFVDTAGRSPHNSMGIAELRHFVEALDSKEVFLVLSCTTKSKDLLRAVEDFRALQYTRLIFTKIDETDFLGPILNVVQAARVPVAYVTNGQDVPDDILPVDPYGLAKLILGVAD